MPYPTLPDRRIPYDNDGTVVMQGDEFYGTTSTSSGGDIAEWNDYDLVQAGISRGGGHPTTTWFFFPEQREVTAFYAYGGGAAAVAMGAVKGSNDTTNGLDGTWETATLSGGDPALVTAFSWRDGIKAISFTGGKKTIRMTLAVDGSYFLVICHLYGEKVAGQTPDDLIFIDHYTTPGVEYTAPEDFGDRPLGTSVTRQFRVKNASATLTANTINIQCNDADFVISTDNTTWVATINIASLGPGAESSTMYVRNTTPNPGNLLGPRFSRIVSTVGSWT